MFDLDRWTEIAVTLRSNRLRTFLTAAGVFWGMFMLVVMLGFGDGLERGIKRSMSGFATNSVYVWGRRTSMPYKGMRPGRRISYDNADAAALAELPGIEFLAPRNQLGGHRGGANVVRGNKTGNYSVMGDMPEFGHIQPMVFEEGRFVNHIDVQEYRKVAVIGRQVYDELFVDATDPIGQSLRVRGVYFQVVGMFHASGNDDRADRYNATIHIPFTTFQRVFNYGDHVAWFAMTGRPDVTGSDLEAEARKVLAERHKVHPDDENAIGAFNAEEEFRKITVLFRGIRLFVWFVQHHADRRAGADAGDRPSPRSGRDARVGGGDGAAGVARTHRSGGVRGVGGSRGGAGAGGHGGGTEPRDDGAATGGSGRRPARRSGVAGGRRPGGRYPRSDRGQRQPGPGPACGVVASASSSPSSPPWRSW
ncbi:MAG: ABC transporter permease [Deltaproteobacteria bacterium]|nr:ABC transporter permease [Deltaproteobacteria bacterium]